jgi:predicted ATP-grasp superfamily ATP-dependent carboligase
MATRCKRYDFLTIAAAFLALSPRGSHLRVAILEYLSGGGWRDSQQHMPEEMMAEGQAMAYAIAGALQEHPDIAPVLAVDSSIHTSPNNLVRAIHRIQPDRWWQDWLALAKQADWTILIAPESQMLMSELAGRLRAEGARLLVSSAEALRHFGDKWETYLDWQANGLPTIPTCLADDWSIQQEAQQWSLLEPIRSFQSGWVLKARHGAGCDSSRWTLDAHQLQSWVDELEDSTQWIVQPRLVGKPGSLHFFGATAESFPNSGQLPSSWKLFGPCSQIIHWTAEGIEYQGGRFPWDGGPPPSVVQPLSACLRLPDASLLGWIGIDFLWLPELSVTLPLEINARWTSAFLPLHQQLGPTLGKWIGAQLLAAPRAGG